MQTNDIKNLIKEFLEKINIEVKSIEPSENSLNMNILRVEVSEPHFFTSRDGEGLMALNHLVRRVLESKMDIKEDEEQAGLNAVLIDINGFQEKKIDSIKALAHMMAERARYFKSSVEVDPMSSFERRIIHEFLANEADLKTESTGFGPSRRVVIKYIGSI